MSTTIVRYSLKPDRLEEHLELIEGVFRSLAGIDVPGIHYAVYRSADGHDFTHIATFDSDEARQTFGSSPAFAAFTADIADRCDSPPDAVVQIDVAAHA